MLSDIARLLFMIFLAIMLATVVIVVLILELFPQGYTLSIGGLSYLGLGIVFYKKYRNMIWQ